MLTPIHRIEYFLDALCGEDVEVPAPVFRIEYWLAQWAEQSGGTNKVGTAKVGAAKVA